VPPQFFREDGDRFGIVVGEGSSSHGSRVSERAFPELEVKKVWEADTLRCPKS